MYEHGYVYGGGPDKSIHIHILATERVCACIACSKVQNVSLRDAQRSIASEAERDEGRGGGVGGGAGAGAGAGKTENRRRKRPTADNQSEGMA